MAIIEEWIIKYRSEKTYYEKTSWLKSIHNNLDGDC
jgi:hypothetical protein